MTNETLGSILHDMRDPENDYITNNDLRDLADRIEAAAEWERERAEAMSLNASIVARKEEAADWRKRTGNAAAMRDVLVWMKSRMNAAIIDGSMDCYEALDKIEAALAAPPRNCDRFSSGEEAWIAFERERPNWCDEHSSKDPDCTDCEMADCGRCMAEWLLGTKGGAE